MKRRIFYSSQAWLILWALSLQMGLTSLARCQAERIALDGGGVFDDIQTVVVDETDVAWAASMGTGIFRVAWASTSWDHDWDEYLAGKGIFGLDAIAVTSGETTTEYVLAGTAYNGIYSASSTTGAFSNWAPANNYWSAAPAWKNARAHDVAFYCNASGSYATDPQDQYFVILRNNDIHPIGEADFGVYRWIESPAGFSRIDGGAPEFDRDFDHFCRDNADPNVLYVIGDDNSSQTSYRRIYRIKGDYTSLDFDDMDFAATVTDQDYTIDVYGFNQWDDGIDVYSYALIKWHDTSANADYIGVFVWLNMDQEAPGDCDLIYTPPSQMTSVLDEQIYGNLHMEADVVGRPYEDGPNTYHYLWLAAGGYGAWIKDTRPSGLETQINGTTSVNSEPTLKSWSPRCLVPDIQSHASGNEKMRLFYGSHHMGVWYLVSALDGSWTHSWTHLENDLHTSQTRDVRMLVEPTDAQNLILAGNISGGIYERSPSAWSALGETTGQTCISDPLFHKSMQRVCPWTANNDDNEFYFGSNPVKIYIGLDNTYDAVLGGLYGVDEEDNEVSSIDFDTYAGDSEYEISEIVSAKSGNDNYLYVATGLGDPGADGVPPDGHVICRKVNGGGWARIYSSDDEGLGLLSIAPDPHNVSGRIFVAKGNYFGFSAEPAFQGEVGELNSGTPWSYGNIFTENDLDYLSVHDVSAVADPSQDQKYILFWGTVKQSAQNRADAFWEMGNVWMRRWSENQDAYVNDDLYALAASQTILDDIEWAKSPACPALQAFVIGDNAYLLAMLTGRVFEVGGEEPDDIIQTHLYLYNLQSLPSNPWSRLALASVGSSNVYPGHVGRVARTFRFGCIINNPN